MMGLSWADVWKLVHDERQRLVDDLQSLDGSLWETPSLCRGWAVHDVVAHLLDSAETGRAAFVVSMLRARGDFHRANQNGVDKVKRDDPRQTLEAFRQVQELRRTPPAHRATRLVEAIVHGEDIRRPLGLTGSYPRIGVHDALAYQIRTSVKFDGGRERADQFRLTDTDSGVSWGDGPEVTGRAVDLLLVVSGRRVNPDLLGGPGAQRMLQGARGLDAKGSADDA
ncbi:maleylpyruvate isomerase family mycothiol-dependent enzyme [Microbacterium sp. MPKO10]|uniref:maleylpyruvate isomerase family mycothiol-dependent enzyme n=1 Tax=Microbacterium sp. MPKO10 TaxID=2989818 RepID=UPI002795FDB6|nr:maleylpyruvate isomerase family mycothiol-dependent enzyme [Microbacterium sp. MPKO10]